jgi:heme/copper-type cytochrome/quinol oxidase subunit 3
LADTFLVGAFLVTVFLAVFFFAADIMWCGCLEREGLCLNFELVWRGKFVASGFHFAHEP